MARQEVATHREGERWRWPGHMGIKGLACGGGRKRQEGGGEHNNQPKEGCTGHRALKRK